MTKEQTLEAACRKYRTFLIGSKIVDGDVNAVYEAMGNFAESDAIEFAKWVNCLFCCNWHGLFIFRLIKILGMSGIVTIVFILIVVGCLVYLINRILPIDANIKLVINVVILLAVIAWLLSFFGLLHITK